MHPDVSPVNAKYSIFLPVKNGGQYIESAIDSILEQVYSDFVLVILENKSEDDTLSLINSYKDQRIVIFDSQTDLSMFDNWNRVYELLKTRMVVSEFCTIIGHDDLFYPDFLEKIDNLIANNPGASIYQTHFDIVDEWGRKVRPSRPIPYHENCRDFFLSRCWGQRDSYGTGYVFRTVDYLNMGGIPDLPLLLWSDDLMVMSLAKLSLKVAAPDKCFAYRLHKKSTSGAMTRNKYSSYISAAMQFSGVVNERFPELLADDYGRMSFGYMLWREVMFLNSFTARCIFDDVVRQELNGVEVISNGLMGEFKSENIHFRNAFDKFRYLVKKYYYAFKLIKSN